MEVYLVRHAHAGPRMFGGRDRYRQLSEEGFRQSDELARFFADVQVRATLSSPATRCSQTIQPTAAAAGLDVTEHEALWEETGLTDVVDLIESTCSMTVQSGVNAGGIVVCSHGNVIPAVVERLGHLGTPIYGRGCERASIWRLRRDGDEWAEARYLTPRNGYEL